MYLNFKFQIYFCVIVLKINFLFFFIFFIICESEGLKIKF